MIPEKPKKALGAPLILTGGMVIVFAGGFLTGFYLGISWHIGGQRVGEERIEPLILRETTTTALKKADIPEQPPASLKPGWETASDSL